MISWEEFDRKTQIAGAKSNPQNRADGFLQAMDCVTIRPVLRSQPTDATPAAQALVLHPGFDPLALEPPSLRASLLGCFESATSNRSQQDHKRRAYESRQQPRKT